MRMPVRIAQELGYIRKPEICRLAGQVDLVMNTLCGRSWKGALPCGRYLTEYLNSSVVFWMSVIDCAGPSGPAAKTKPPDICHGTIRVKEGHGL